VPSEAAGHDFDLWPDKAERVRVVYNGVDLKEFSRSLSRADARRRIGVPDGGMLLAAIGQLGPRKGSDVIIKAMARLAAGAPALKLMFVGNPHGGQEEFARGVRAQAGASGLEGRVFFFPYTRDILPYYEAADVNLLISREEGFGRTIIEAAALGVPSIGARTGGIPEIILDGRTGLLVRSEDDAALAEAIGRLLAGSDALGSMGDAARRHVEQNFSIRAHTDRIMELYDSL
ncbi:glycosyltransferase family 4 protein, partial [Candidatus Sumerlaeota bacterium]|nr:glycosyltransferase family 4 protein [Candidatus Sumerlaeota bacterium]